MSESVKSKTAQKRLSREEKIIAKMRREVDRAKTDPTVKRYKDYEDFLTDMKKED